MVTTGLLARVSIPLELYSQQLKPDTGDVMSILFAFNDTPYMIAMVITWIVTLLMAVYVWVRRTSPGGRYFALLMLMISEWAVMAVLEMAAVDLPTKILFGKLSYIAVVSLGLLFFSFAMDFCGRKTWIRGKQALALWIFPAVVLVLAFTNEWHGLLWPSVTLGPVPGEMAIYSHGLLFYLFTAYAYFFAFVGVMALIATAMKSSVERRAQISSVLIAAALVIAGNLLYIFGVRLPGGIDPFPFLLAIAFVYVSWCIFSNHLFDIMTIASAQLIADAGDGIIVIDGRGIVVELNDSAGRMIGVEGEAVGISLDDVLVQAPGLKSCLQDRRETPVEARADSGGHVRWLDIRSSCLHDSRGKPSGWLYVLRDITDRKRAEEKLQTACDRLIRSNEALKREIADREKAEGQALAMLQEKEVLLKEIHHRVKNNLQIISSLLSLQAGSITGESLDKKFRESQDRIRTMALIHEKLYQSKDLSHIDFEEYVGSLTGYLSRSYVAGGNVRIDLDISDISLDIDVAIPCGLIINELVSNSFKYAFPGGRPGTISVRMKRVAGEYELTVADDGKGLPEGFDFRTSPSLGLLLVNTLVGQLDGVIMQVGTRGTCFKITFPVPGPGK
ncbi:sensor histidine kinase [Methanocella arvoryzae]|uniref:Signal transduction histidine kinase n=1 Tax=Methanocella arvoryzae (strain DSM 22066 / NBRC 105507 / MRE50) TaxID=351160 RepID=Q0W2T1_METAR|nr:histidine kinase N-terminal 7TM domain-containing protein [Methanocella arvoryzae]CAJ37312.1 putative signal transduction histidine kinase [Methanocella arvoryzae MRE50]